MHLYLAILFSTSNTFLYSLFNTAMDASRTALRIGASQVDVIFNEGIDTMSALRAEYDDAVKLMKAINM